MSIEVPRVRDVRPMTRKCACFPIQGLQNPRRVDGVILSRVISGSSSRKEKFALGFIEPSTENHRCAVIFKRCHG